MNMKLLTLFLTASTTFAIVAMTKENFVSQKIISHLTSGEFQLAITLLQQNPAIGNHLQTGPSSNNPIYYNELRNILSHQFFNTNKLTRQADRDNAQQVITALANTHINFNLPVLLSSTRYFLGAQNLLENVRDNVYLYSQHHNQEVVTTITKFALQLITAKNKDFNINVGTEKTPSPCELALGAISEQQKNYYDLSSALPPHSFLISTLKNAGINLAEKHSIHLNNFLLYNFIKNSPLKPFQEMDDVVSYSYAELINFLYSVAEYIKNDKGLEKAFIQVIRKNVAINLDPLQDSKDQVDDYVHKALSVYAEINNAIKHEKSK